MKKFIFALENLKTKTPAHIILQESKTLMRPATALLLSTLLVTPACTNGSYDHAVGGAMVGAGVGAAGGLLCCHQPVNDVGPGILIGAVVGALVGYLWDLTLTH